MNNDTYLGDDDLIFNPTTRVPICLCIDTSGSMNLKDDVQLSRINRVKKGIRKFYKDIENNDMLRNSAEIAIVEFNTTPKILQEFKTIDNIDKARLTFNANGKGDLGKGVLKSIELLEKRKSMYRKNGIDYYQPWLVIMTDGRPTGESNVMTNLKTAQGKVLQMEKDKKITVITVFIGKVEDGADLGAIDAKAEKYLKRFSEKHEPIQLVTDTNFTEFFEWLGKSVSIVANDGDMELDFADLTDWEEI